MYAIYYNNSNNSHYFTTKPLPIWQLSKAEISTTWTYISTYWYNKYFAHSSYHILLFLIPFQLALFKRSEYKLALITLIMSIGGICYFLLFYSQFKDHDYYFMVLFPIIILILINALKTLLSILNKQWIHSSIKIALIIFIIIGINYSKNKLHKRYTNKVTLHSEIGLIINEEINEINLLGIPENAKFIIAPDATKNGGLYSINRMGWKISNLKNITSKNIKHLNNLGADYLLLATNNAKALEECSTSTQLIYSGKKINIYKLQ